MKTELPAGTAAKTGEGAPPADEHVLSSTVCRVLGQDTAGNERARPRPPGGRPRWGHARVAGRTTESSRGPTCAAGGAGAAEGAEAALRGASHGGLTARAPALQPRGSPRRGSDPGASGRPLCAQRGARPDGAMVPEAVSVGCSKCPEATVRQRPPPASPFLERKPKSCRPCLPRRGRDLRKVLRTRHVPRVRPGAPHTPATGASLGESGLNAAGTQTRQPEVLGQPASSLWADVAVSRNHGVSLRGTICTRKRRNLPPEPSLGGRGDLLR